MSDPVGGKYQLIREIARGGMGAIWEAHDPLLRRRVALKLINPEIMASDALRQRFEQEAVAIAQLRNPNVIQVYDFGIDGKSPYIVMELLDGEDLQRRLDRVGRLSPTAFLPVFTHVSEALGAAHAAGIVHLDLKPANVFLARGEPREVVKVLDFGIAAVSSSTPGDTPVPSQRVGALVGTPSYMSPEQVQGLAEADHRSDLWSLGVVAYRALTGQMPFSSETFGDLLAAICTQTARPPSEVVPQLGPGLDAFFERAFARRPGDRFQTAREMSAALAAVARETEATRPAKILVVDDEPDAVLLFKQRFRQHIRRGVYELVFAANGNEALEALQTHPDIDMALSDINMPGMDGLTFLARVGEVNPHIKVVMVSAYGDMGNIRSAMNRGAFDFVTKPIDFNDLEATIRKGIAELRVLHEVMRNRAVAERARANLARYFSPSMVDMLGSADVPLTAGWRADVAVLFADIAGFTTLAEDLAPEAVLALLRNFHARMEAEVFRHGGTLEKYIGDALLAAFGVPRPTGHDASSALACARSMLVALTSWNTERVAAGEFPIRMGIGLHFGPAVLGDIGSERNMAFAVIGDTVNTASRLQTLTRDLDVSLVTSNQVMEQVRLETSAGAGSGAAADSLQAGMKDVGEQMVRGRTGPVHLWMLPVPPAQPSHPVSFPVPPVVSRSVLVNDVVTQDAPVELEITSTIRKTIPVDGTVPGDEVTGTVRKSSPGSPW